MRAFRGSIKAASAVAQRTGQAKTGGSAQRKPVWQLAGQGGGFRPRLQKGRFGRACKEKRRNQKGERLNAKGWRGTSYWEMLAGRR